MTVNFTSTEVPGYFAGVTAAGALYQLGWRWMQDLQFLGWEARYLAHLADAAARVAGPALVVPLWESAAVLNDETYDSPAVVENMPSSSLMRAFDTLEVDFELACSGDVDSDCAKWDHCITLEAWCADDADDDAAARARRRAAGGANASAAAAATAATSRVAEDAALASADGPSADDDAPARRRRPRGSRATGGRGTRRGGCRRTAARPTSSRGTSRRSGARSGGG